MEKFSQKVGIEKMTAHTTLVPFKVQGDDRGSLIPLEKGCNLPFDVRRVYYIFGTREGVSRGFHAHKKLKQMLIAVSGSVRIVCEYQGQKKEYLLNRPDQGLLIEGFVWREMHDFSPDCVLTVLADEYYNESDYIRDYETFLKEDGKL